MHAVKTVDVDDELNRAYSFSLMALTEANLPTLAQNITLYGESLVPTTSKPVGRAAMLRRLQPVLSVLVFAVAHFLYSCQFSFYIASHGRQINVVTTLI